MLLNDVRKMDKYVAASLMPRRAVMLLAASFGIVSLFLAVVGIYGVLAFFVTQRFREIGIRIALGSTPARIFALILREGLVLLVVGVVLGVLGVRSLEQVLQSQLYGLAVMDPTAIAAVTLLFAVVALAACSIPARRATQVDPVTVLNLR
jgi:ABC-type antimicrobial peptide transport system permease subunit